MGFFFKVLSSIFVGGKYCSTYKADEVCRFLRNPFFMSFPDVPASLLFSVKFSSQHQQQAHRFAYRYWIRQIISGDCFDYNFVALGESILQKSNQYAAGQYTTTT